MAARTARANIHFKAPETLKSAKTAIDRADIVISSCFLTAPLLASGDVSGNMVLRFSVANLAWLCHKRNFIARLIKGCRVDVRAGYFIWK